ncbi:MAG: glycosyltransferase [bacterium]
MTRRKKGASARSRGATAAAPSTQPVKDYAGAVVSVLIGARDAVECIEACLESLEREAAPANVEVIVAVPNSDPVATIVETQFPWVEVVRVDDRPGAPNLAVLRAAAFARSRGAIVAFTDAHCKVKPGWVAALRRAIEGGADVAAGAVMNGTAKTITGWTSFLFDYGEFLPPVAAGPAHALSGNNIAYRREMLGEPAEHEADGLLKYFVNARLAAERRQLRCAPEMIVVFRRRISLGRLLRDRFHFGRCFAAQRLEHGVVKSRAAYRVLAPLLPALVIVRLFRRLLARPVLRTQVVRCALPLAIVAVSWGLGEAAGALLGRGRSCREVY